GPFRVTAPTEATTDPVAVPAETPARSYPDIAMREELAQRLERARQQRPPREQFPPLPAPPPQKVFHLFTGDQDFHDTAAYTAVVGVLRAVGRHCQVYVDRAHTDLRGLQPTIDDAVRTFDEQVYPVAQRRLGQALD